MTNKELIMRHPILTTVLVLSLMFTSARPANAFIDIGGAIQRAQMIVNQVSQIANQVRQLSADDPPAHRARGTAQTT